MVDIETLIGVIPVGAENAETSMQIWRRLDLWAPVTIRDKLNRLAAEGRIERLSRSALKAKGANYYYRPRQPRFNELIIRIDQLA